MEFKEHHKTKRNRIRIQNANALVCEKLIVAQVKVKAIPVTDREDP
jgi:hypothetical protein